MHGYRATIRDQKFTEPVALSSTASVDLPLPGNALGCDFVLLALRARCKRDTNVLAETVRGSKRPFPQIASFSFSNSARAIRAG